MVCRGSDRRRVEARRRTRSVASASDINSSVSVGSNCLKVSLPVHGGTFLLYTPTEDSEEYRRGKRAFTNRKKPTGSRKNTNTCISLPATPPPTERGRRQSDILRLTREEFLSQTLTSRADRVRQVHNDTDVCCLGSKVRRTKGSFRQLQRHRNTFLFHLQWSEAQLTASRFILLREVYFEDLNDVLINPQTSLSRDFTGEKSLTEDKL